MQLRKATKQKAKLRVGVAGTSGSGKTYSALLLARGLASDWNKVAVIDTENQSADLYDHLGEYNVLTLSAPFSPERYSEAVKTCEEAGMEVVIIDSITHEWDGKGGCLEIVESFGGRYQDWAKVTPRHNAFVQSLLTSSCHIITTVRRKQDYEMTKDSNGKLKVEKAGLKEITREGFEYELTLSFALNQSHLAGTSKDRTGLFMDKPEFIISEKTGELLKSWAEEGLDPRDLEPKINAQQIKLLHTLLTIKGAEKEPILTFYKVSSTKDLTEEQANRAIAKLKQLPDKQKTSNPEDTSTIESLGKAVAADVPF